MEYFSIILSVTALAYGGIIDYRRREIPNVVPIALLFSGVLAFSGFSSIMGLVAPLIIMLCAAGISKTEVPGGDFKLLCSLGFATGLFELELTMMMAGVLSLVYSLLRRLPIKRHVPLCTYVALAYLILQIAMLITKVSFSF